MIVRYEDEVRAFIDRTRALQIRRLRIDRCETWRGVGDEAAKLWKLQFGIGDTQSLGATLCHVAAEVLEEDPDGEPWN